MICPSCKKEAPWVENKMKYGRNYGKSYMCYYCHKCGYYVGCHNNTRKPLGTMVSRECQQYRRRVHDRIDPLWKQGVIKRGYLYSRISKYLGYSYHTGESDIETCKRILSIDMNLLRCSKEEFEKIINDPNYF